MKTKHKTLLLLSLVTLFTSCSLITPDISSSNTSTEETSQSSASQNSSNNVNEEIELQSINLDKESVSLSIGETIEIHASFVPENTTNTSTSWMTSNPKVATINDGIITAIGVGTCQIIVTSSDGKIKNYCNVNVRADSTIIPVSGISIDKTSLTIQKGTSSTLKAELTPANTTEKNVIWSSSNPEIASCNNNVITAVNIGTCTITCKSGDGLYSATCTITVVESEYYKDGYSLYWHDEFDGTSLNNEYWTYDVGNSGWGNSELQYYTQGTNNIIVSDGIMQIVAKKENYSGSQFTSARIATRHLKTFKYGYIEAKIKVPAFNGSWPAFWMLGDNIYDGQPWPYCGEIDIMEYANNSPTLFGTLHWNNNGKNTSTAYSHIYEGNTIQVPNKTEWHTYAIDWDENKISVLFDDKVYYTKDITPSSLDCFHDNFYLLFNLAIGGNFTGVFDANAINPGTNNSMSVDYVRVYQKN